MVSKDTLQSILVTLAAAAVGAVGMHVFVYPLALAPMGVDGIATMLQYVTQLNAGYFSILINLPLLLAAWFVLKKTYVLYTLLFTLVNSGLLVLLRELDFYQFAEGETLIAVLCAGLLLGLRTGLMLRIRASSGGIDIIAAMCQKKLPYVKIESIIGVICNGITVLSYFVYRDFLCIILAIFLNFVFEYVVNQILRGSRSAVEVKVVTDTPDAIAREILTGFQHGGYSVQGRGLFSGKEKTILSSVINPRQIPDLMKMCRRYPGSFAYYSPVDGVHGNFRWYRDDEVK